MQTEALKQVLKDKEEETSKSKKQICQAKNDTIKEYRDSDALLAKLGGLFADGGYFNDYLCQVKAFFSDLDLSQVTIDAEGQTPAHLIDSEGTDKLFRDDTSNPYVDKEAAP